MIGYTVRRCGAERSGSALSLTLLLLEVWALDDIGSASGEAVSLGPHDVYVHGEILYTVKTRRAFKESAREDAATS